jgi:hypothetical protein
MTLTLLKYKLANPSKAKFLVWNSDKSFRRWYCHIFRGVTTSRIYFTVICFGFVTAGSVPDWRSR